MTSGPTAIALFWLFYMSGLGVIFPYLSLYFRDNLGLSGDQLGIVLAVTPAVGMLAQPLWGQWADRTGRRRGGLALLAVGAAGGYLLVGRAAPFAELLVAVALLAVFTTPAMAVASSVSFAVLGAGGASRFGRIRVWGTVGYLGMILAFPAMTAWWRGPAPPAGDPDPGLALIFPVAAGFCAIAALTLARVPASGAVAVRAARGDLSALLRQRAYRRLLALSLVAYGLLTGPILLFPVFVGEHGGTAVTVARLWIPMLALEIPLILFAGAGLRRIGARGLIAAGIACDGLRWSVSALAPSLAWVFAIQLLHGAVVVGLIIGMQLYVEATVPERLRSTGQTLLGTVVSTGSVLSSLWTGAALERLGADVAYLAAGFGALALGVLVPWLLPPPEGQGPERSSASGS